MNDEVAIRNASTVVLARNSPDGPEVFMLERNVKSEFVAGAYVFPGGAVDRHDGHEDLSAICAGLDDNAANQRTCMVSGGLGFWVAAIRECFEESGVLIACRNDVPIDFSDTQVADRFSVYRESLNRREMSFSEICREESLVLPVDKLTLFSRWLTPLGMPRRFDTCFFICPLPDGQAPLHDGHETVNGLWCTPEQALSKGEAGEIKLVAATTKILETLRGHRSVADLIVAVTPTGAVSTICPTLIHDNNGKPTRVSIPMPDGEVEHELSN